MDGHDRHCGGLDVFGVRLDIDDSISYKDVFTTETLSTQRFLLSFLSELRDLSGESQLETR